MLNASHARLLCLVFISCLFPTSWVGADIDTRLQDKGWDELVFDNKSANQFLLGENGGIEVISEHSVSLLKMPLEINIEAQPMLRWRWSVLEATPVTDLSVKGEDDRSLAIYIAFPFVAEGATAFELIERKIVEAIAGKDAPGRVLMYVWGGNADRGEITDSPHLGNSGMMKTLRAAATPSGQWFSENINIAADYQQAFGKPAPNPLYIAIGADTDDTESTARGIVMDLDFTAPDQHL